jgi:hypothetical protein
MASARLPSTNVYVRRRLGDARRAHHAAGTADILDDHLLAQHLGEAPADDPAHDIGAAAGRERHHHGQRPGGPALGGSRGMSARAGGEQRTYNRMTRTHDFSPSGRLPEQDDLWSGHHPAPLFVRA